MPSSGRLSCPRHWPGLYFRIPVGAARRKWPWDVFQDPSASPIADPAKHLRIEAQLVDLVDSCMEPKNCLKRSASLAITSINKGIEMEIEMRQHKYVTIDVIGTWANAKAFKLPALFLALLAYISCNHELSIAKP